MRSKRSIKLGDYDTAVNGWTLTGWKLEAAPQKTNYVERLGGDGSWDFSTALTDGVLRYDNRSLSISLETSEGNRLEREDRIRQMVNQLDGMTVSIKLPDDDSHYLTGRLKVVKEYNDTAHAAVSVTANCEPWKYNDTETVVHLAATTTEKTAELVNSGRRVVAPLMTVTGADVTLKAGGASMTVSAGTYKVPDLVLLPGSTSLKYSSASTASIKITYREAVLE